MKSILAGLAVAGALLSSCVSTGFPVEVVDWEQTGSRLSVTVETGDGTPEEGCVVEAFSGGTSVGAARAEPGAEEVDIDLNDDASVDDVRVTDC